MSKLLLLILAFVALWWLAKGFRSKDAPPGRAPEAAAEHMVNCAHCGLYLPQSEAVHEGGRYYCCAEHRRLAG